MPAPKEIKELVQRFSEQLPQYKRGNYNESQVRADFIDPLFKALGWDMDNKSGYAEAYRDVIYETSIDVKGAKKTPDYGFYIGGVRKFFVEAKKPSVVVKDDISAAFQIRRYGWSANLPLSILTDFEEFAVYDTRIKPYMGDKAAKARMLYYTYEDYVEKWDEIAEIFGKEQIQKGKFDAFITNKKGKGTEAVDESFLKDIEQWRELLAKNIKKNHSNITSRDLNYAVQITIDRILFLRICEDRKIEPDERLKTFISHANIYKLLLQNFYEADDKYNSGLFHFKQENNRAGKADGITPSLTIDNAPLKQIIKGLYHPESQYEFSVMPADILGSVYERFLGKTIISTDKQVRIEEKPEVKKAGGVYYTPYYIVDYIVQNTVGELVKGKTPDQIAHLKILDPSCGSGSFLIVAYQYLLDYYLAYYTQTPEKYKKKKYIVQSNIGIWRLEIATRKQILLRHIYGVDIDSQAVEVSKLSLLLKVLEGQSEASIKQNATLFNERALPNLADNIKCGNSLIGSDFYNQGNLALDEEDRYRINVFDWHDAQYGFGNIMQQGGFDAVIGNPPYVKEYTNRVIFEDIKQASLKKYYQGKMDMWYFFTCYGIDLLKDNGKLGFIAPNNWITNAGASILRNKILSAIMP